MPATTANAAVSRLLRIVTVGFALLSVSSCDPAEKLLGAGPFSGQVVDADSGHPITGAFVGFSWGGSSWIEGHFAHLLVVLVQADANGRYQVPWQGDKLTTAGLHSINWAEEVWAPGYVLLQTGEEEQRTPTSRSEAGAQIRLQRATSAVDALDSKHRMNPEYYTNYKGKYEQLNDDVQRALSLALYRDSYHRICEVDPPDEALDRRYVEEPLGDASHYRYVYYALHTAALSAADPHEDTNAVLLAFYRKAGWMDQSGMFTKVSVLDRSLLPELCRLSRFAPAFTGNPS